MIFPQLKETSGLRGTNLEIPRQTAAQPDNIHTYTITVKTRSGLFSKKFQRAFFPFSAPGTAPFRRRLKGGDSNARGQAERRPGHWERKFRRARQGRHRDAPAGFRQMIRTILEVQNGAGQGGSGGDSARRGSCRRFNHRTIPRIVAPPANAGYANWGRNIAAMTPAVAATMATASTRGSTGFALSSIAGLYAGR